MQRRSETWGGVYVGDPTTGNIEALPLPKPALVRQFRAASDARGRFRFASRSLLRVSVPASAVNAARAARRAAAAAPTQNLTQTEHTG